MKLIQFRWKSPSPYFVRFTFIGPYVGIDFTYVVDWELKRQQQQRFIYLLYKVAWNQQSMQSVAGTSQWLVLDNKTLLPVECLPALSYFRLGGRILYRFLSSLLTRMTEKLSWKCCKKKKSRRIFLVLFPTWFSGFLVHNGRQLNRKIILNVCGNESAQTENPHNCRMFLGWRLLKHLPRRQCVVTATGSRQTCKW